jgi:hypothetical protein
VSSDTETRASKSSHLEPAKRLIGLDLGSSHSRYSSLQRAEDGDEDPDSEDSLTIGGTAES